MANEQNDKSEVASKQLASAPSRSKLEVSLKGTPENGQQLGIAKENSLETIFGTEHPEMATALLSHCPIPTADLVSFFENSRATLS